MFLTVLACVLIGIVVHELGHIAVLSYYGYKTQALVIGMPIKPFVKIPINWIVNELYITPYLLSGTTIPIMPHKPTGLRWLAIHLAGPLSNTLVIGLVFLFRGSAELTSLIMAFVNPASGFSGGFWEFLIALNFAYGIGELVPYLAKDGTEILKVLLGQYRQEII